MNQKLEPARCPQCGRQLPPSQRFCFCGYDLRAFPISLPSLPRPGVAGWLLWFCLQLLVLNPLAITLRVMAERGALYTSGALRSVLAPMIDIDSVVRMALALIGVAGGILLVVRNRRAVPFVRVYLVAFAVTHIALVGLPWSLDLPVLLRNGIVGVLSYRALLIVLWVGFWLLYFNSSKRVELTYGGIPQVQGDPLVAPDAGRQVPERSHDAALTRRPDVIMQVTVHKSGAVSVDGQRVDLDRLGRELDNLKRREGVVWYYGGKESPDLESSGAAAKVAAQVLEAITGRGLAIRLMGDE